MEFRQKAGTKTGMSQKDIQIRVVTNWQHTQELSPAFRRLMVLLLEPKHHEEGSEVKDK